MTKALINPRTDTDSASEGWLDEALAGLGRAQAAGALDLATRSRARTIQFDVAKRRFDVELVSGASFSFPPTLLGQLAGGLSTASLDDLAKVELTPLGTGVHWPALDEDLSVDALLTSVFGAQVWSRERGAKAGRVKSPAKASAARANGAKGGRPRKSGVIALI
jgi:Protein of unknown function (DUF2442)